MDFHFLFHSPQADSPFLHIINRASILYVRKTPFQRLCHNPIVSRLPAGFRILIESQLNPVRILMKMVHRAFLPGVGHRQNHKSQRKGEAYHVNQGVSLVSAQIPEKRLQFHNPEFCFLFPMP